MWSYFVNTSTPLIQPNFPGPNVVVITALSTVYYKTCGGWEILTDSTYYIACLFLLYSMHAIFSGAPNEQE